MENKELMIENQKLVEVSLDSVSKRPMWSRNVIFQTDPGYGVSFFNKEWAKENNYNVLEFDMPLAPDCLEKISLNENGKVTKHTPKWYNELQGKNILIFNNVLSSPIAAQENLKDILDRKYGEDKDYIVCMIERYDNMIDPSFKCRCYIINISNNKIE